MTARPDRIAEAENAAKQPFSLDGAEIEYERRPVKIVYSVPAPAGDDAITGPAAPSSPPH